VSVGMLFDPRIVLEQPLRLLAVVGIIVFGKSIAAAILVLLLRYPLHTALTVSASLAQIGEFSFILAALGASLGATPAFLYPVVAAVSALTAMTTPWSIRASATAAAWVDRKLPQPLQTAASLYGSWLERVRAAPDRPGLGARVRRLVRALSVDAAAVTALTIGAAIAVEPASAWVRRALELRPDRSRTAVIAAAALLAAPFTFGLVANARRLGLALASAALPEGGAGRPDLAAAPRRALIAMLQLGAALLVLAPIVAVTQPFLPGGMGAALLGVTILTLGIAFWRSAANLQGHVRASAQAIVEALARQGTPAAPGGPDAMGAFRALFPGLGEPVAIRLPPESPAVGKTLATLEVRGRTGATVLAISRPDGSVVYPTATEALRAGDALAVAGSREAVDAARELLVGRLAPGSRLQEPHRGAPEA